VGEKSLDLRVPLDVGGKFDVRIFKDGAKEFENACVSLPWGVAAL